jgi:hypothetical protein
LLVILLLIILYPLNLSVKTHEHKKLKSFSLFHMNPPSFK